MIGGDDEAGDASRTSSGFTDLIGDVKPLKGEPRRRPEPKPRRDAPRKQPQPKRSRFRFPDPDEPRLGAAHGVSDRVLQGLRRGDPSFEERIDLHGLDRTRAPRQLAQNLASAASRGVRCVLVVHGVGHGSAGGAVLRESVAGWLSGPECARWVLAFAPAGRNDGGEGATYVLLRRG